MLQQISDAELEIMKIVWGNPKEVTLFSYIMDGMAARGKPCQKNTLIVLLFRLINKGFLRARKIGRHKEYTALVSEAQYQTAQTKNFLDKIYEGSVRGLVSNLISGDLLTEEEYEELKKLLENPGFFGGKWVLKDKISRQWQYYIWLVVILRLLLPFGTQVNLLGKAYHAVDQAITQATLFSKQSTLLPQQQVTPDTLGDSLPPATDLEQDYENRNSLVEDLTTIPPLQDREKLFNYIWLVWLMVALGLLIRKITIYQSFVRYINAGLSPVSDIEMLDQLSIVAKRVGIKKTIELCVNPLVSSPLGGI